MQLPIVLAVQTTVHDARINFALAGKSEFSLTTPEKGFHMIYSLLEEAGCLFTEDSHLSNVQSVVERKGEPDSL